MSVFISVLQKGKQRESICETSELSHMVTTDYLEFGHFYRPLIMCVFVFVYYIEWQFGFLLHD